MYSACSSKKDGRYTKHLKLIAIRIDLQSMQLENIKHLSNNKTFHSCLKRLNSWDCMSGESFPVQATGPAYANGYLMQSG